MSTNRVVLFGEKAAGVYRMSDIYIPNSENPVTPEESGKIVPAVGSLIVDDTTGMHNQQYTVTAVDPETYEPTLVPSAFSYDLSSRPDRALNYSTDLLMLYFSKATIELSGQTVQVNRLIVDNKLSFFGNHAATYQLLKYNTEGELETISRWYTPNGLYSGTAIPMLDTGVEGVRKCDGCYTDVDIEEGETVICRVYSAGGIQISEITLIAKKAHLLNEIASVVNPIVDFVVASNQEYDDTTFVLYTGQDPKTLVFYPYLKYSDNRTKFVSIDGVKGFVYGLEDINTDIPGVEYKILFKYYLGDDDVQISPDMEYVYIRTNDVVWTADKSYYTRVANVTTWTYNEVNPNTYVIGEPIPNASDYFEKVATSISITQVSDAIKFITKEAIVRIEEYTPATVAKFSFIPVWNASAGKYDFKFLRYMNDRINSPKTEVENNDTYNFIQFGINAENPRGDYFEGMQHATILYKNRVGNETVTAQQVVYFDLRDPRLAENSLVKYLISDDAEATKQYGRNTNGFLRPRITYVAGTGYRIPPTVFAANQNQTATEVFLDNFYYQANPPVDIETGDVPVPTHFRIKNINGDSIMNTGVQPVSVSSFSGWLDIKNKTTSTYVGSILLVEFIRRYTENNITKEQCLYAVPVDVIQ